MKNRKPYVHQRSNVSTIRKLYRTGIYTQTDIAQAFDAHSTTIHLIVRLKTWRKERK